MKRLVVFKRKWIVFFVMVHSTLIVTGCVEDMTLPPLEAQFQLLDVTDNPTISFKEGEDILFDYRIINSGNKDVTWEGTNDGSIPLFPVFKILNRNDISLVGSVYDPKLIRFELDLGRTLAPGEEVVIRVTWLGDLEKTEVNWGGLSYPGNVALPKGEYRVEFEHMLETPKFDNFKVHVFLDFEVI
ncbi:hypothetical protein [Cyclobacterium jeungdonense]|uniref:Intracellular proteinase inhibitor BsuPI domain-containing protein n=1 Tax=Cyclobacterium jeungdonense TaxID=708087 RepID=A0ABT8C3C4_9BACT|nr:hypothetical protein [Cyclobacterium jeungdonense]MDN3687278.1 hypothetical protein [Cyclobacterium jeungdonense]